MSDDDSVQLFIRLVNQRHQVVKEHANALFRVLASEAAEAKKDAAQNLLKSANALQEILAAKDVPQWLKELSTQTSEYVTGRWTSYDLLANFVSTKLEAENHSWSFSENGLAALDFDSIFEHHKKNGKLPKLLDELIRLLEQVSESGEVDSRALARALAKVIATLRRSKDGSYFSINSAWDFFLSFANNYLWGELAKIPVLGSVMEALKKTIKELNEEMFRLHVDVSGELQRISGEEIDALKKKTNFPFVAYDRKGRILPTARPQLTNASA